MEQQDFEALDELEALEAFLASNPNELNNLLDKPFGELTEQLCNLGFDGKLLHHHISGLESFSKEVWIDSVGINTIEHFLKLTPHQYCDSYPEIGAPLLVAVVNSIKISDQHAQLLQEAGGTSLSKKQKLGLEIGLPVAATALYFAPRLLGHQNFKKHLLDCLSTEQLENVAAGKIAHVEIPNNKGVVEIKQSILGTHMDVKITKWSDRVAFELRHTSPYIAWKAWATRNERRGMEATKSAIKAVENDVKLEEANLFAEDERRLTKERESILDDEHIEMETISRDSIETGRVDSLLGSEYDFQRMQQFNKFLEERNGRGIIRGRSSEEIASVRFSSFVSNELDAKASGVYNELNGIERREVGIEENKLNREFSTEEHILKEQLVDQASREADKFEVEVAQSIKKGERTADQKFMDTLKFEGDF